MLEPQSGHTSALGFKATIRLRDLPVVPRSDQSEVITNQGTVRATTQNTGMKVTYWIRDRAARGTTCRIDGYLYETNAADRVRCRLPVLERYHGPLCCAPSAVKLLISFRDCVCGYRNLLLQREILYRDVSINSLMYFCTARAFNAGKLLTWIWPPISARCGRLVEQPQATCE
ncbi:uncharacterized protein LAESUDRAFT_724905, partial [Laetiporus sulphureus 93-53]